MGSFRSIVRPGVLTPVGTILATMAVMAAATVTPVPRVDLERYVGRWYEIARYPNRFQKDCARDTTAEYALRPDGRLRVTNRCTKADGSAVVAVGVGRRPEGSAPDGAVFKVRYLADGELSMETARTLAGSPGVAGGQHSDVQRQIKIYKDGRREVIGGLDEQGNWKSPLLCGHPFAYGETFMFESTGGGGYGNPWERDAAQVREDVLDEYVSLQAARERYGVVIDPATMLIDEAATARMRASMVEKAAA